LPDLPNRRGADLKSPIIRSRNRLALPAIQITKLQVVMTIDSLRAYCLAFPNTTEKLQWGDALCFKVGGKMFVVVSLDLEDPPRLSLKCDPETFAEMIEREGVAPAPYVGRYKWIGIEDLNTLPPRELEGLIARSYELVVAKLPKKPGRKSRRVAPKRRRAAARGTTNRHRGESRLSSPATPPYMRVRIRRFDKLVPPMKWQAERSWFGDAVRVSLLGSASIAASPRCAHQRPAEAGWLVHYPHRDPSTTGPSYRSGLHRRGDYYALC